MRRAGRSSYPCPRPCCFRRTPGDDRAPDCVLIKMVSIPRADLPFHFIMPASTSRGSLCLQSLLVPCQCYRKRIRTCCSTSAHVCVHSQTQNAPAGVMDPWYRTSTVWQSTLVVCLDDAMKPGVSSKEDRLFRFRESRHALMAIRCI